MTDDRPEGYWKQREIIRDQDYSRDELEHYLAIHILREIESRKTLSPSVETK